MRIGILILLWSLGAGAEPGAGRDREKALRVLDRLVREGPAAEEMVDWQHFQGYGYQELSETHKAVFRKAFLEAFSRSFQEGARGPRSVGSFAQAKERFRWNAASRSLEASNGPWRVDFTRDFKVGNFRW